VIAEVHLRRNEPARALEVLEKARTGETEALRDLAFLRGDALARLDRLAEAQAAFEEEIRSFPENTQAYARLAIVWGLRGRTVREVHDLLETMHARNPGPETAALAASTLRSMGDERGARSWQRRAGAGSR
jgi:predicted Zn-dependent protease